VDFVISELLEMSQQTKPENIFGEGKYIRQLIELIKQAEIRFGHIHNLYTL